MGRGKGSTSRAVSITPLKSLHGICGIFSLVWTLVSFLAYRCLREGIGPVWLILEPVSGSNRQGEQGDGL